jgi:hypothetical protein
MFVVVGVWVSPFAAGAVVLGVMLGLRADWLAVLAVVAGCAVLAAAAVLRLRAWSERRDARATASWPQQRLRAEVIARPAAQVPAPERPAIGPVYNYNFNFHGPAEEHAAVIRNAITEGGENHGTG